MILSAESASERARFFFKRPVRFIDKRAVLARELGPAFMSFSKEMYGGENENALIVRFCLLWEKVDSSREKEESRTKFNTQFNIMWKRETAKCSASPENSGPTQKVHAEKPHKSSTSA